MVETDDTGYTDNIKPTDDGRDDKPDACGLTLRQRRFVFAFVGPANGNATRAAKMAGYEGGPAVWAVRGYECRRNSKIQSEIERVMAENSMGATEVLARLSDIARGPSAFMRVDEAGDIDIDLDGMRQAGKLHLIKSIKTTRDGTQIDFYDAAAALVQLGRYHRLFTDRVVLDFSHLSDDELMREIQRLEQLEARNRMDSAEG
jgi:hypothetical protein